MASILPTLLVVASTLLQSPAQAAGTKSYNGLAITPQMGWDDWNAFGCKIDEEVFLSTAQKVVDYGLRDLGVIAPTVFNYCLIHVSDRHSLLRILLHDP